MDILQFNVHPPSPEWSAGLDEITAFYPSPLPLPMRLAQNDLCVSPCESLPGGDSLTKEKETADDCETLTFSGSRWHHRPGSAPFLPATHIGDPHTSQNHEQPETSLLASPPSTGYRLPAADTSQFAEPSTALLEPASLVNAPHGFDGRTFAIPHLSWEGSNKTDDDLDLSNFLDTSFISSPSKEQPRKTGIPYLFPWAPESLSNEPVPAANRAGDILVLERRETEQQVCERTNAALSAHTTQPYMQAHSNTQGRGTSQAEAQVATQRYPQFDHAIDAYKSHLSAADDARSLSHSQTPMVRFPDFDNELASAYHAYRPALPYAIQPAYAHTSPQHPVVPSAAPSADPMEGILATYKSSGYTPMDHLPAHVSQPIEGSSLYPQEAGTMETTSVQQAETIVRMMANGKANNKRRYQCPVDQCGFTGTRTAAVVNHIQKKHPHKQIVHGPTRAERNLIIDADAGNTPEYIPLEDALRIIDHGEPAASHQGRADRSSTMTTTTTTISCSPSPSIRFKFAKQKRRSSSPSVRIKAAKQKRRSARSSKIAAAHSLATLASRDDSASPVQLSLDSVLTKGRTCADVMKIEEEKKSLATQDAGAAMELDDPKFEEKDTASSPMSCAAGSKSTPGVSGDEHTVSLVDEAAGRGDDEPATAVIASADKPLLSVEGDRSLDRADSETTLSAPDEGPRDAEDEMKQSEIADVDMADVEDQKVTTQAADDYPAMDHDRPAIQVTAQNTEVDVENEDGNDDDEDKDINNDMDTIAGADNVRDDDEINNKDSSDDPSSLSTVSSNPLNLNQHDDPDPSLPAKTSSRSNSLPATTASGLTKPDTRKRKVERSSINTSAPQSAPQPRKKAKTDPLPSSSSTTIAPSRAASRRKIKQGEETLGKLGEEIAGKLGKTRGQTRAVAAVNAKPSAAAKERHRKGR